MSNVCIRIATKDDCDSILRLENQYGIDVYSESSILSMFNYDYYYVYVLELDNKVIGYISATIIIDECNLIKIIVDNDYRKCGYGKMLLEYLIDKCKEMSIGKIYLEVREDNGVAKSFYQKNRFKRESIRPEYYDGVDAEIFWYYVND